MNYKELISKYSKKEEKFFYTWDVSKWWLGFVLFFLGPILFFLEKGPIEVSFLVGVLFYLSIGFGWYCLFQYLLKR